MSCQEFLNKPIKVTCHDGRQIYGILVCVSKPYSIILQHGVCFHEARIDLDLQFHYSPQFASKHFLVGLDPTILNAYENLNAARTIEEIDTLQPFVEQARLYDQEFMKGKFYIGSLVLPGAQIASIHLLK